MKIYVATSWRNKKQQDVVNYLRGLGHEVYDFRNPGEGDHGFHWSQIDAAWETWTPEEYKKCLSHPLAVNGYASDFNAMVWADCFVGVQPFGRSASMEMGWASGQRKKTILLLDNGEPELMVKMFDSMICALSEINGVLEQFTAEMT